MERVSESKKRKPTLTLHQLVTGYREKAGRKVVSLPLNATLYSGELTCLVGANGAGKSTLLRTLTAFASPLEGEVRLLDRAVSDYSRKELARLLGVVLTDKVQIQDLSVYELVGMGRMPYTDFWGRMEEEDRRAVEEALQLVGIEALSGRMVHTLSDGEMQKAMIAKTLAQQTPFIFLDEPTAFLDYPSKVELMLLLRRLAKSQQKTIFLSTHDLDLVLQIADRVWMLDRKRGLVTGIPEDLALQGKWQELVNIPQLRFSFAEGLFRIQSQCERGIQLCGEVTSEAASMLGKALNRMGMSCSASEEGYLCIDIRTDSCLEFRLLEGKTERRRVHRIEEVLAWVNEKQPVV